MPATDTIPRESVAAGAVALVAALVASGSLVARSSPFPSWLTATVGATSLGQLTLLGLLAWLWSAPELRRNAVGVTVGGVLIGVGWALLLSQPLWNPTGLGPIGGPDTPVAIDVAATMIAVGGGIGARPVVDRLGSGYVGRLPWTVAALCSVAALMIGRIGPAAAGFSSAVAVVVVLAAVERSGRAAARSVVPQPPSNRALMVVGAAIGLASTAAVTFAFVVGRHPDRADEIDDVMRLTGPLFVSWTWVVIFGISIGVVGAAAGVIVRNRSISAVGNGSAVVVITALTFLSRAATTVNIVNVRRDGGDQFFYHVTSNLLANGRGFIHPVPFAQDGDAIASALHGPAFPVALSFWSRLGGTTYFDHQLVSVLLGVPQVVFGVMLAHLIAGRRVAVVAAALLLVYPNIWVTDGSIWVEGMMAGLTTAATYVMYRWRTSLRLGTVALAGALIGLAALTRGEAVLMTVLLVLPVVAVSELSRKLQFRHLAVCAAAFVAVIAPWMIYNSTRFDLFVPLSTNSNEVIYYANCSDSYYGSKIGYWSFACQERHRAEFGDPPGDESVRNHAYRELGLDYARDNASQVPNVIAARVGRQWELFRPLQNADFGFVEGRPHEILRVGLGMYYVMMLLAVVGSVRLRRRGVPIWPLWSHGVMVTFTAIYAYGNLRFRAPFEPILCVMAAVGAVALFDRLRPVHSDTADGDTADGDTVDSDFGSADTILLERDVSPT